MVHELTESVNQNHEHIKWAARAARSKFLFLRYGLSAVFFGVSTDYDNSF